MEMKEPMEGLHFVGKKDDLIKSKRSFRTLEDRDILLVYHQGVFYALDYHCYHSGGPLENGDIEEIGGKLCIICPKHKYKISLLQGEGLYKATDRSAAVPTRRWFSKGVKQRVHTVMETNGDVYVKLSVHTGYVESDFYQGEKGKLEREKAEAAEAANKAKKIPSALPDSDSD